MAASKSDIARAQLTPLADGERPATITIAALGALLLAAAAVVPYWFGVQALDGTSWYQALPLSLLLVVAAVGMLRMRYWAVLGFQVCLALQIIVLSLALSVSSSLPRAALTALLITAAGLLFWRLIKIMARIQLTAIERQKR